MANKVKESKFVELSPREAIHDSIKGFHKAGVADKATLREFDALCLPEVKSFSARQIKQIRQREKASQGVFAKYLNLSASTVRQWEQGVKHPNGASLLLLNLVAHKGLDILIHEK